MPQKGQMNSKASLGKCVTVKSNKGTYLGLVDRTGENLPFDKIIYVRLPCGSDATFFQDGLSDREYIRRAKHLKKLKPQKGQITKHEFTKSTILFGKHIPTCEHCEVQQVKNRTKYPGRTQYYLCGVLLPELPKCITRKKPEDGTTN